MFNGFPEETIQFFLDLRFHNNAAFFHEQHDRYVRDVQTPFYDFINELAPTMRDIDPQMETRPHKCLSRIHRDTRFSKDKSPYRDHLWLAFRRQAEQKEGSVNFFFELGPQGMGWGMGTWGENKPLNERFRREIAADPMRIAAIIDSCDLPGKHMTLTGSSYKRIEIPEQVPDRLHTWYAMREFYIPRTNPQQRWAFSKEVFLQVRHDFEALAPIYRMLRGIQDELQQEEIKAAQEAAGKTRRQDEW